MIQQKVKSGFFAILAWIAYLLCGLVGVLYMDDWKSVDGALSMAATYLGIVASVSLALIALQVQSYERITANDKSSTAHIRYISSFKKHVKTEVNRVISIAAPIILGIPIKLCEDAQNNRIAVGIVACSLCLGLVNSVMLPLKYGKMMSFYLDHVFNSAETVRKQKKKEQIEELRSFKEKFKQ